MQHTYHHPHNSTINDNTTYSNPVPYIEEHSHPYTNLYEPQSTHIQQNDSRYYLAPQLPQYQELTWNGGMHQPMEHQTPDPPYHSGNVNPFTSDYSAFLPAAQHSPVHRMGENSTRSLGESLRPDMPFYRAPDGPRLRTAQACQKCRTRKAKVTIPVIFAVRSLKFIVAVWFTVQWWSSCLRTMSDKRSGMRVCRWRKSARTQQAED